MNICVPELSPGETAAFLSPGPISPFRPLYRVKRQIKKEGLWLIQHGFTRFIVACGNDYGCLALLELARLRQQGHPILCYAVEVRGERVRRRALAIAKDRIGAFGDSFPDCPPELFAARFLSQASVIVTQRGRRFTGGEVPGELRQHYRVLK